MKEYDNNEMKTCEKFDLIELSTFGSMIFS